MLIYSLFENDNISSTWIYTVYIYSLLLAVLPTLIQVFLESYISSMGTLISREFALNSAENQKLLLS